MVKPLIDDPDTTVEQVAEKLTEVLDGPQQYVAYEVLTAYRGGISAGTTSLVELANANEAGDEQS